VYLPCKLPIISLLEWSPFENSVWSFRRPITRLGVTESIERGELEGRPYSWKGKWKRIDHIRRIAYLVVDDNHELRGLCVGLKMALRRSRDVLSEQDSVIKKLAMSGGKSQISC
jgi:hypothetical protein